MRTLPETWQESKKNLKLNLEKFPNLLSDILDSAYLCGLEDGLKSGLKTIQGDEKFEMFWKKYPRHIARKNALKAWTKLKVDDVLFEKIMHALEKALVQIQWREKQYIPHPATWLNGERWEDEVESPKSVPTDSKYAGIV